eukprot:7072854-Ditylum_brightwellii.AAC.1
MGNGKGDPKARGTASAVSAEPTLKTIISKAKNLSLEKESDAEQEVLSSCNIVLPTYVCSLIYKVPSVGSNPNVENVESRSDLDTHANMPVIGKNVLILGHTGRVADTNPFTSNYDAISIPIVHDAIKYECPYTGNVIIFIVRNALSVPAMDNNWIPLFVMRETGLAVKDMPKIYVSDPSVDNNVILGSEYLFPCGIIFLLPISKTNPYRSRGK